VKVSWSRLIHVDDGDCALRLLRMKGSESTGVRYALVEAVSEQRLRFFSLKTSRQALSRLEISLSYFVSQPLFSLGIKVFPDLPESLEAKLQLFYDPGKIRTGVEENLQREGPRCRLKSLRKLNKINRVFAR
jgi:hypothetical protein